MRTKKLMAAVMAAAMSLALAVPAFAADVTSGTGSAAARMEQLPDSNKVVVSLPTVKKGALDYLVDPMKLIAATSNAAYASGDFTGTVGNKTLYFQSASNVYTNFSTPLKIINKSKANVTAYVYATPTGTDTVKLARADTFATWNETDADGNTTAIQPLIYLEVQQCSDAGAALATPNKQTVKNYGTTVLPITINSMGGFTASYDSKTKSYVWSNSSVSSDDDYTSVAYFNLTGKAKFATDTDADDKVGTDGQAAAWKDVNSTTTMPSVDLTWSVVPASETTHLAAANQAQTWDSSAKTGPAAITLTPGTAKVTKIAISTTGFGVGETETELTAKTLEKNGITADYDGYTIPASNFSKMKQDQALYARLFWDDGKITNITVTDSNSKNN